MPKPAGLLKAPLTVQTVQSLSIPEHESVLLDPSAHYSTEECAVYMVEPDTMEIVFRISGQEYKRFVSRMGTQNRARYFWENVIKRAIMSHIY